MDELGEAVDQVWGPEENEEETDEAEGGTEQDGWRTVVLLSSITKIVARISNRVFVGVPLCSFSLFFFAGTSRGLEFGRILHSLMVKRSLTIHCRARSRRGIH